MSVEPSSYSFSSFAKTGEDDRQMHLQIWSWTTLRSLGLEFFTGCNGISTGVDITFFMVKVPLKIDRAKRAPQIFNCQY